MQTSAQQAALRGRGDLLASALLSGTNMKLYRLPLAGVLALTFACASAPPPRAKAKLRATEPPPVLLTAPTEAPVKTAVRSPRRQEISSIYLEARTALVEVEHPGGAISKKRGVVQEDVQIAEPAPPPLAEGETPPIPALQK